MSARLSSSSFLLLALGAFVAIPSAATLAAVPSIVYVAREFERDVHPFRVVDRQTVVEGATVGEAEASTADAGSRPATPGP